MPKKSLQEVLEGLNPPIEEELAELERMGPEALEQELKERGVDLRAYNQRMDRLLASGLGIPVEQLGRGPLKALFGELCTIVRQSLADIAGIGRVDLAPATALSVDADGADTRFEASVTLIQEDDRSTELVVLFKEPVPAGFDILLFDDDRPIALDDDQVDYDQQNGELHILMEPPAKLSTKDAIELGWAELQSRPTLGLSIVRA